MIIFYQHHIIKYYKSYLNDVAIDIEISLLAQITMIPKYEFRVFGPVLQLTFYILHMAYLKS